MRAARAGVNLAGGNQETGDEVTGDRKDREKRSGFARIHTLA